MINIYFICFFMSFIFIFNRINSFVIVKNLTLLTQTIIIQDIIIQIIQQVYKFMSDINFLFMFFN